MPDTAGIVTLTVRHAVGEVSSAQLVICDGNMPDRSWPLADGALFVPGVAIVISAGHGNSETPIFSGIVVKLGLRVAGDDDSHLVVECRDKAIKMPAGRRNASYGDQTDSDIMALLAGNHGLHHDIDATSEARAMLLQYDCSDWDFLMPRAEFNGLLVTTDGGKVVVKAPAVTTSPALKVTWGVDLMEISADTDARHQCSEASAVAWDPAQQAFITQSARPQTLNAQGNLSTAMLAAVMSPSTLRLQGNAMLSRGDLSTWSKAQQVRAGLSRIRGTMTFHGSALARPAELIEQAGMGARFNGNVFVSAVEHRIAHSLAADHGTVGSGASPWTTRGSPHQSVVILRSRMMLT